MTPILSKLSKQFLSKKSSNFKRFLYEEIDFKASVIGIKGGRGSGKTTLLHQYAKNSKFKKSQEFQMPIFRGFLNLRLA